MGGRVGMDMRHLDQSVNQRYRLRPRDRLFPVAAKVASERVVHTTPTIIISTHKRLGSSSSSTPFPKR